MRLSLLLATLVLALSLGLVELQSSARTRIIKTGLYDFEVVSEADKLAYKRNGRNFIDVTDTLPAAIGMDVAVASEMVSAAGTTLFAKQLKSLKRPIPEYNYPAKAAQEAVVKPLLGAIDLDSVHKNLAQFTSYYTRYYKLELGVDSANWLHDTVALLVAQVPGATVTKVKHNGWDQFSIIVSIPGESPDKVVVGAHQDSINLLFPNLLRAPGADDDGLGTVTTLESLRLIAGSIAAGNFTPYNTLEFHYYSAEEGGLLGSIDVFLRYFAENATVVGMLQQDMTGYTQGTYDNGVEPHFGLINDYTSAKQNQFIKTVVDAYCKIPVHETKCGYACSDHASALENGYPASFLIESEFKYTAKQIHLTMDTMDRLDFEHIREHIKLTVGYAVELAAATKLHK